MTCYDVLTVLCLVSQTLATTRLLTIEMKPCWTSTLFTNGWSSLGYAMVDGKTTWHVLSRCRSNSVPYWLAVNTWTLPPTSQSASEIAKCSRFPVAGCIVLVDVNPASWSAVGLRRWLQQWRTPSGSRQWRHQKNGDFNDATFKFACRAHDVINLIVVTGRPSTAFYLVKMKSFTAVNNLTNIMNFKRHRRFQ